MDRLNDLRSEAGGSRDSSRASDADAYLTANESSSKYYSLTESSLDISPIKDVSLASTAVDTPDGIPNAPDSLIGGLSPIGKKNHLDYKIGKHIEAANILSGGVDIFDDNSYDGNELIIDDKANTDLNLVDEPVDDGAELADPEAIPSIDTEVTLQIDGKNVNAIDIGNGLYLYRKEGNEELAAVQIVDTDQQPPSFKFLKVRENADRNLEVYEEFQVEVPKDMPAKAPKPEEGKSNLSHVPIKDISKVISEPMTSKVDKTMSPPKTSQTNTEKPELETINTQADAEKKTDKKSPVIGSFMPMAYHSTPNKDGIPLTKTMVDMHLHTNRLPESAKKTIEVNTDSCKKLPETQTKSDVFTPKENAVKINSEDTKNEPKKCMIPDEIKLNSIESTSDAPKSVEIEKVVPTVESTPEAKTVPETKEVIDEPDSQSNEKISPESDALSDLTPDSGISKDSSEVTSTTGNGAETDVTICSSSTDKSPSSINDNTDTAVNKIDVVENDKKTEDIINLVEDLKDAEASKAPDNHLVVDKSTENVIDVDEVPENAILQDEVIEIVDEKTKDVSNVNEIKDVTSEVKEQTANKTELNKVAESTEAHEIEEIKESIKPTENIVEDSKMEATVTDKNADLNKVEENVSEANKIIETVIESNKTPEQITEPNKIQESIPKLDKVPENNITELNKDPEIATTEANKIQEEVPKPTKVIEDNSTDIKSTEKPMPLEKPEVLQDTIKPKNEPFTSTKTSKPDLPKPTLNNLISAQTEPEKITKSEENTKLSTEKGPENTPNKELNDSKNSSSELIELKDLGITTKKSLTIDEMDVQLESPKKVIDNKIKIIENPKRNEPKAREIAAGSSKKSNLEEKIKSLTSVQDPKEKVIEDIVNKYVDKAWFNMTDSTNPSYGMAKKTSAEPEPVKTEVKPVNNNDVPFGQWTEANKQAYLSRIKEPKIITNPNQIKQPFDLNRRDVLKKIDIQRQSSNNATKNLEATNQKQPIVRETVAFVNKKTVKEDKIAFKQEPPKSFDLTKDKKADLKVVSGPSTSNTKTETAKPRKEMNNQDLIDQTIEGMIRDRKPTKFPEAKTYSKINDAKPSQSTFIPKPGRLYDVEKEMNRLHGIPFKERPAHELPIKHREPITYARASLPHTNRLPKQVTLSIPKKTKVIDLDSDQEIIEHEPVTGDMDVKNTKPHTNPNLGKMYGAKKDAEGVITEKDFDKFARRNSVTYDNCVTIESKPNNVVEKDVMMSNYNVNTLNLKSPQKYQAPRTYGSQSNSIKYLPIRPEPQSKLQMAYQNALTAKRQKESPITVLEDKPVKVVFVENNSEYVTSNLNVQGKELSPAKKYERKPEPTPSTTNDEEIINVDDDSKTKEEKKPKHQRKQVLTPIESADMEMVKTDDPTDTPKRKRKLEENVKPGMDKSPKSIMTKKTYLLSRSTLTEEKVKEPVPCPPTENIIMSNAATAIDNLVKAAELLETQSKIASMSAGTESPLTPTPVKRGRGRPRKYPLPENGDDKDKKSSPSPQKKVLPTRTPVKRVASSTDSDSTDDEMVMENWTMGKINEDIVCPICKKLFRSENVVFKHVKHCTGPSPSRSDSDKRSPRRRTSMTSENSSQDTKISDNEYTKDKYWNEDTSTKSTFGSDKKDTEESKSKSDEGKSQPDKKKRESKITDKRKTISKPGNVGNLVCEICGKTFRQMSYLVGHKMQHKKDEPKKVEVQAPSKSVFSCEVCKKDFRKLHHLVQHRSIHNPSTSRARRKSSADQRTDKIKTSEDQSAGFRCERCDKSFRKLHHLVEHRETHDGINRQKVASTTTVEKTETSPQCDVCHKTFRKLHHLIEHKEQHVEVASEKSDDKSVKSSLATRDIIHECRLCYMVFPNEHSLNKHFVNCQKKKRQSLSKAPDVDGDMVDKVEPPKEDPKPVLPAPEPQKVEEIKKPEVPKEEKLPKVKPQKEDRKSIDQVVEKKVTETETKKRKSVEKLVPEKKVTEPKKEETANKHEFEKPKFKKPRIIDTIVIEDTPPKKAPEKTTATVTKKQKTSNLALPVIEPKPQSSDDDDVRYMFNPNFTPEQIEGALFMKVRDRKRNSLQIERPKNKGLLKRRISLQTLPKQSRIKPKFESKIASIKEEKSTPKIVDTVPSTDSDDSDVKYSFPVTVNEPLVIDKPETVTKTQIKMKRKSVADRRRSLVGVAKRKSVAKANVAKIEKTPQVAAVKRRLAQIDHRCDCGALFGSAALLARHTTLTHTPPRIRKRRSPIPETKPAKTEQAKLAKVEPAKTAKLEQAKSAKLDQAKTAKLEQAKTAKLDQAKPAKPESRKASVKSDVSTRKSTTNPAKRKSVKNDDTKSDDTPKKLKKQENIAQKSGKKRVLAHSGVPPPAKMKRLMEKLKK